MINISHARLANPREQVPCYDYLKYRRIKMGNCLDHQRSLLLRDDLSESYRAAIGELPIGPFPYRHCWLEGEEVVVDLTLPDRFYDRELYYHCLKPSKVYSYSVRQVAERLLEAGYFEFWDLDAPPSNAEELWAEFQKSLVA